MRRWWWRSDSRAWCGGRSPIRGQGHLHDQLDGGPIVATPTAKLRFHGVTSGAHKLTVILAANDHSPLGPQQTLDVTIP